MFFPQYLKDQRRWIVRPRPLPGLIAKQPQSALAAKPAAYVPKYPDESDRAWRYRWDQECILTTYDEAVAYQKKHAQRFEGVGFILHHFNRMGDDLRLFCIDIDHAFENDDPVAGVLRPQARETVEAFKGKCFMEYSRSRCGVHIWGLTRGQPFSNHHPKFDPPLAYDVLCASHVATTGDVFEGQTNLEEIDYECLSWQPWFKYKKPSENSYRGVEFQEWWDAEDPDPIDESCHLATVMKTWPPAIKDHGRSNTSMAAAVRIMEHGVVGKEAVEYLRLLRTEPEFSESELRHKIEDAYVKAIETDKFGQRGDDVACEFDVVEATGTAPETPPPKKTTIRIWRADEFAKLKLKMEWLVKKVVLDIKNDVMFIGGQKKTFKTSIMMDLFVSIASGHPFLGYFEVVKRQPCLFLTTEIGEEPLQALLVRVCKSKGIEPPRDLVLTTWMPKFRDERSMSKLSEILEEYKPGVAAFDPVYFGAAGMDVGDMFKFVEVMQPVRERCAAHGSLPVFAHHAVKPSKSRGKEDYGPMDLGHLYGAGFDAFARQWLLLAHAEAMRGGVANLHLSLGGSSAGQGPELFVRVAEGESNDDDPAARKWDVQVSKPGPGFSGDLGTQVLDIVSGIPRDEPPATAKYVHNSVVITRKDASLFDVQTALDNLKQQGRIIRQGDGYVAAEDDLTSIDVSDIL